MDTATNPSPSGSVSLPSPVNTGSQIASDNLPSMASVVAEQNNSTAAFPLPLPTATAPFAPQNDVQKTTQAAAPGIADDSDLIEKEWVVKAKQIIGNTKNNPYQQSREMSIFRAEYMQKRYNRQIKLSE